MTSWLPWKLRPQEGQATHRRPEEPGSEAGASRNALPGVVLGMEGPLAALAHSPRVLWQGAEGEQDTSCWPLHGIPPSVGPLPSTHSGPVAPCPRSQ